MDTYKSMTELVRNEKDWMIETQDRNSKSLITAIHGGGIECGTSELALLVAELSNANYFTFKGLKPKNNRTLHVTSTNYDNPNLLYWNQFMNVTIAIHGYSSSEANSYIGGLDERLISLITHNLKVSSFNVEAAPDRIAGREINNITNKNAYGMGVQIEISTQQRKEFFSRNDFSKKNRENTHNWTEDMYYYANAICAAINDRKWVEA
ncbi:poly-gamma-glutamate hydrolase family protein [Staphylococcus epidermidis]|uniref:poly-gamma-glutamate hydrolase family protein n=1 Tax=Staphylococcus epidermidis TaxID=1282 RepID=UPI000F5BE6B9|nr:poly-gamma-glutamate hydrolase family protein [Staphylococcus epidermidis]MCG1196017.1 poly-gamma-glutamate hydrolase family protein [Staphylococcus epidermidis]